MLKFLNNMLEYKNNKKGEREGEKEGKLIIRNS